MNLTVRNTPVSAHVLKLCAVLTMLIDHIGYVFARQMTYQTYYFLRAIGRIAFPLFAFLLSEGVFYTRSRRKYLCGLLIFAVLSEIPFDLLDPVGRQNIFWTLALGLAAIILADAIFRKMPSRDEAARSLPALGLRAGLALCGLLPAAVCAWAAEEMSTDYGAWGLRWYLFSGWRGGLSLQQRNRQPESPRSRRQEGSPERGRDPKPGSALPDGSPFSRERICFGAIWRRF